MNVLDSLAARRGAASTVALAILLLIVHSAEVFNLAYTGRVWWFDCAVGLVVCGVALARERSRLLAAGAGLTMAVAATVSAEVWHLPGEPGIAAIAALTVLVASAVRASPVVPAAAVAAGGAALTGMMIAFHHGPGTVLLGAWWACALAAGLLLRGRGRAALGKERLASLIDRFARRGTPVRLQVPDGLAWPPELTATICRVVRESLASVTRHAALATAVTVTITRDQDTVTVEVTDDAPAVGARVLPASGRYGRAGIRKRVESLGGTYRAGPHPGSNWSVRATVPVAVGPVRPRRAIHDAMLTPRTPARQTKISHSGRRWGVLRTSSKTARLAG